MREKLRFLGMDVHAETIAVAIAEPDGEVRSLGTIANREDSIRKFIKKLGPAEQLRACYEAGPTGFVLYWQLAQLSVQCAVVAPSLVPKKPGDHVKTDRRDALKLARSHRSGDLTAVWVPDEQSEALRDLVRQREAAKQDQLRARHRLTKFLLRTGRRPPLGLKAWTERYLAWLEQIRYAQPAQEVTLLDCLNEVEHMTARVKRLEEAILELVKLAPQPMQEVIRGLQALRGVAHISAVTIATELGNISSRFESARKLMGYCGVFPSEDSSGKRKRQGSITKAGNAHLRRIVVESAWSYRHLPRVGAKLRKRQQGVPAEITEIAWKAQNRLHKRYMKLMNAGKDQRKVMTAVGRELLGFIWAIAVKAEQTRRQPIAA
ncbi:MAG TPA: IS110 family transposase [Candidatus Sulfotelmatobacter sp.]|jgi:transposase|nr:IS110 family transposase [Candidatus Sulfotelmatobacter sp.]